MRHRWTPLAVVLALTVAISIPLAVAAAPNAQATAIPHETTGAFENCTQCHQVGGPGVGAPGGTGMPANHANFTNATCLGCHQAAAAPAPAQPTPAPAQPTPAPAAPTPAPAAPTPAATPAPTTLPQTGGVPMPAVLFAGAAALGLGILMRRTIAGR